MASPGDHVLISREMILQQNIGLNATLFGGDMMARMDKACGICASLVSINRSFVTLKVSELQFLSPVRAGDVIELYAAVKRAGSTSMTIMLSVKVYAPTSNTRKDVVTGEFVMVAVDANGRPETIVWKQDVLTEAMEGGREQETPKGLGDRPSTGKRKAKA